MNTKALLSSSALVMGVLGIAGSFLPQEVLAAAGLIPTVIGAVLVQLLAALLFGFAMANWMARGSLIGGIYNRPLAVGNVAHFVIGALAASKAVVAGERSPLLYAIAVLYVLFAIGFSVVLLRSPVARSDRA